MTLSAIVKITVTSTSSTLRALLTAASATAPSALKYINLQSDNLSSIYYNIDAAASASTAVAPSGVTSLGRPCSYADTARIQLYAASNTDIFVELYT